MKPYAEIIAGGDYLLSLRATRDQIAHDLQECDSMRDKAALYNRMTDVLAKIEDASPPDEVGDPVDEIAHRRAARRSGSA